jgi:hypothetical protein
MSTKKRPIAVLKEQKKVPDFIIQITGISTNIGSNLIFGAAVPTPVAVNGRIVLLTTSQVKAKTHVKGAAGDRDVILGEVRQDAIDWTAFVQLLADHATSYTVAISIIQAAGLGVKVNGRHIKAPFAVQNRKGAAGIADMRMTAVEAIKGTTTYEWRYSIDAGKTWIPLYASSKANQEITGLESGTSVLASGRAIADNIATAWITEGFVVA